MLNKDKINFLGESAKEMLREIFAMVEDYNKQIKAAKKAKSDSYKSIDLTRFKRIAGQMPAGTGRLDDTNNRSEGSATQISHADGNLFRRALIR